MIVILIPLFFNLLFLFLVDILSIVINIIYISDNILVGLRNSQFITITIFKRITKSRLNITFINIISISLLSKPFIVLSVVITVIIKSRLIITFIHIIINCRNMLLLLIVFIGVFKIGSTMHIIIVIHGSGTNIIISLSLLYIDIGRLIRFIVISINIISIIEVFVMVFLVDIVNKRRVFVMVVMVVMIVMVGITTPYFLKQGLHIKYMTFKPRPIPRLITTPMAKRIKRKNPTTTLSAIPRPREPTLKHVMDIISINIYIFIPLMIIMLISIIMINIILFMLIRFIVIIMLISITMISINRLVTYICYADIRESMRRIQIMTKWIDYVTK